MGIFPFCALQNWGAAPYSIYKLFCYVQGAKLVEWLGKDNREGEGRLGGGN